MMNLTKNNNLYKIHKILLLKMLIIIIYNFITKNKKIFHNFKNLKQIKNKN